MPRVTQFDLSVRKVFRLNRMQADVSLDMFNVINTSVVLSENQNFGPSLGTPTGIFQPRLLRVSTNLKF